MNSRQLAMRDPALAALVGAIAGSDFGTEASFGADFGADFGDDMHGDFGADMHGDFGADMHGDFGAAESTPTPQQSMALWHKAKHAHMATQRRVRHLFPNAGSSVQ